MPHFLIESLPLLTRVWIHVLHIAWIWNKTKIDRRAINDGNFIPDMNSPTHCDVI